MALTDPTHSSERCRCLFYFNQATNSVLFDSWGKGGPEEFVSHLDDSKVQYGYMRLVDDGTKNFSRTKYVYVVWVGGSVGAFLKAKSNTQKNYMARAIGVRVYPASLPR